MEASPNLPYDVLFMITRAPNLTTADLKALGRACIFLRRIIAPILYRHINISFTCYSEITDAYALLHAASYNGAVIEQVHIDIPQGFPLGENMAVNNKTVLEFNRRVARMLASATKLREFQWAIPFIRQTSFPSKDIFEALWTCKETIQCISIGTHLIEDIPYDAHFKGLTTLCLRTHPRNEYLGDTITRIVRKFLKASPNIQILAFQRGHMGQILQSPVHNISNRNPRILCPKTLLIDDRNWIYDEIEPFLWYTMNAKLQIQMTTNLTNLTLLTSHRSGWILHLRNKCPNLLNFRTGFGAGSFRPIEDPNNLRSLVASFPKLQKLMVSDCSLGDFSDADQFPPEELFLLECPNLKSLNIFTKIPPRMLALMCYRLPELEYLTLNIEMSNNALSLQTYLQEVTKELSSFPKLRVLRFVTDSEEHSHADNIDPTLVVMSYINGNSNDDDWPCLCAISTIEFEGEGVFMHLWRWTGQCTWKQKLVAMPTAHALSVHISAGFELHDYWDQLLEAHLSQDVSDEPEPVPDLSETTGNLDF